MTLQSKREVFTHGHPWVKTVVGKDHRHIAIFRREFVYAPVADLDFAGPDFFQTRDRAQNIGGAASLRADENRKSAAGDFKIERVRGMRGNDLVERNRGHKLQKRQRNNLDIETRRGPETRSCVVEAALHKSERDIFLKPLAVDRARDPADITLFVRRMQSH